MYRYNLQDHVYVIKDLYVMKGEIISREHVNKLILSNGQVLGELTCIIYTLQFDPDGFEDRYHQVHCFKTVDELKEAIGGSISVVDDVREGLFTLPGEGVE